MKIYLAILITKIIENTLSTVRIIMIAKQKKIIGSLLNGIIAFVWILSTGLVLRNIREDPYKIIFFCAGSIIGSYLGSFIEERTNKKGIK